MELLKLKLDVGILVSLFLVVINILFDNVVFVKDMFNKVIKKNVVLWNVMIVVYVNNLMVVEVINVYL